MTATKKVSPTGFRGVVGGVTYTDRAEFEAAAHALGYRPRADRSLEWRAGARISVALTAGPRIEGQVWSLCEVHNYVWVALDTGKFVAVHQHSGTVYDKVTYAFSGKVEHGDRIGRVAA